MATPFDLQVVTDGLKAPVTSNGLCNLGLLDCCKEIVLNNYDLLIEHEKEMGYNVEKALSCHFVQEFDRYITAPVNGHKDESELYRKSSSKYVLKDIAVPTLFIHSLDDPVCIKECIPFDDIKENPNCMMIVT